MSFHQWRISHSFRAEVCFRAIDLLKYARAKLNKAARQNFCSCQYGYVGHGSDRVQQRYGEVLVISVSVVIYMDISHLAEPKFPERDLGIIAIRWPSLYSLLEVGADM